jgi:hypothetical protein
VYPSGIVGLTLLLQHRAQKGRHTVLIPPQNEDVLSYLGRIDFFTHLPSEVEVQGNIEHLKGRRRRDSPRFTEILLPDNQGFSDVCAVVMRFLEQQVSSGWRRAYRAFEEVISNIDHHASFRLPGDVFSCAQVQVYTNRIELAFGDLGVGFLATLRANPAHAYLDSHKEALKGALARKYTRWHREDEHHGGGLHQIGKLLAEIGGRMEIVTYDGYVKQGPSGRRNYNTWTIPFPGTLVWVRMPNA